MLCHGDFQFSFSQSVSLGFEGREKVHPQNHGAVPRGCQLPHSFWNILQNPVNGWIFIGFFGFQCRANPEILGYIWILRVKMIRGLQHRLWNFTVHYQYRALVVDFLTEIWGTQTQTSLKFETYRPENFSHVPLEGAILKGSFFHLPIIKFQGMRKLVFRGWKSFDFQYHGESDEWKSIGLLPAEIQDKHEKKTTLWTKRMSVTATWMSQEGSKWVITYLYMGYIGVITHLLTIY